MTTGKTHHPLPKGEERLISLDNHNAKHYNYHNEFGEHTHHLLYGAKFLLQGANLWQTPQRIITKLSYFTKLTLLSLAFSFTLAQANPLEPKNFSAPSLQELQQQQGNTENLQDLKTNEFYLNLNPKEIDSIQKKDDEIRKAFDRFSQKEINYKPVIRPIASMDSISLHPYFTFTLLLPQGSVINHIDSSSPMAVLKFENNAVLIRPNADFKVANLTILYKLKDSNHILNILATFYEKNNELDKLNLVYSYSNLEKLDDLEVIQAYIKENKAMPKQKYSYIQINDITYRIVEDEEYGKVFIKGKKYRVDNNTIYK
ncbi:hypothetical protein [Campylobacter helveticus]|uniref:hypothetical protein n=1 Tax=Campylobacter helveticus TaxID=28898 RepID=UPI001111EE1D|nr:hypothetical protein [Campylobacter helveticus]ELU1350211.1 hypothetical protein [Campylobacter jejuni]MCR2054853.1 hypothetical protein [Campylobacter helveticus]MCR2062054.1 hypothetical protein [Campylobacter helveticus]TNB61638.1 hypothetical protein FDW43_08215 [Campylobacter helveticus]